MLTPWLPDFFPRNSLCTSHGRNSVGIQSLTTLSSGICIKDISRGLADSGAVNQNPGPESATCWLFPDPDLAKSWLYPDPESANPQVEWFVPIGTNHHLGGVASQAGRSFWPGPPSPTEELFSIL